MRIKLPARLKTQLTDGMCDTIAELITRPDFEFNIDDVYCDESRSPLTGATHHTLTFDISTNSRPLLLGQFVYFNADALRGFHNSYLRAMVERIAERTKHPAQGVEFNVHQRVTAETLPMYVLITAEQATEIGLTTLTSPLVRKMVRYGINELLLAGSEIAGPAYEMICAVEYACKKYNPRTCLDLFAGTGALAKVALANGVTSVESVDIDDSYARKAYGRSHSWRTSNAFDLSAFGDGDYDLVLLDPFHDSALGVAKRLLPQVQRIARFFVFNAGPQMLHSRISEIRSIVQGLAKSHRLTAYARDAVLVGEFRRS